MACWELEQTHSPGIHHEWDGPLITSFKFCNNACHIKSNVYSKLFPQEEVSLFRAVFENPFDDKQSGRNKYLNDVLRQEFYIW